MTQKLGVYSITCNANGKVYVGSSKKLNLRITDHRFNIKRGIHSNKDLEEDIQTFGPDAFVITVIEEPEEHLLRERELFWIKRLSTNICSTGYNVINPVTGEYFSEEDANAPTQNTRFAKTGRPILILTKEGQLVDSVPSIGYLIEDGWKESGLRKALDYWKTIKGEVPDWCSKHYKGYMFIYQEDYDPAFDYVGYNRPRKIRSDSKILKDPNYVSRKGTPVEKRKTGRKQVEVTDTTTNAAVTYRSIADAAKALGVKKNKLAVGIAKRGTYKHYKIVYTGLIDVMQE